MLPTKIRRVRNEDTKSTKRRNEEQLKKRDFCGPDFFVVLDTEKRPRKSWVVWGEQGKYPNVIVEILSDSTANIDRTKKKILYQNTFRTPNYLALLDFV
jgi:Uma2 family endonuclease